MTRSSAGFISGGTTDAELPVAETGKASANDLRLLIVDDDPDDRLVIRRALQQAQLASSAFEQSNIASGLAAAREMPFDAIITDHILPDGTSVGLLKELRLAGVTAPVVVVTGYGDEMLVLEVLRAGASDYLPKDKINPSSIFRTITNAINSHRLQHALNQTLNKLRDFEATINRSPAIVFVWENKPGWPIAFVSENVRQFGYEPGDFATRSYLSIVHPDDADRMSCEIEDHLALGHREYLQEYRLVTASGEERWIEDHTLVIVNDAGEVTGFQGIVLDTTERKRIKNELDKSEVRYRTLVEKSPVITYTATEEDLASVMYISPQVEAILGYGEEDFRTNPRLWLETIHPHDRDAVFKELLRCRWTRDEAFEMEYRRRARDGRELWFRDRGYFVYDAMAGHRIFLGTMHDVTERKHAEEALRESEEKHRTLLESLSVGVFRVAFDRPSFTDVNPACTRIFGYSKSELIRADIEELYAQKGRHASVMEELDLCGAIDNMEIRMKRKDGSLFWASLSAKVVRNKDGEIAWIDGFIEDISERKQVQDSIRESEERFRKLFENLPNVAVHGFDSSGTVHYWNKASECFYGYAAAEAMGRNIVDLIIPPATRDEAQKNIAAAIADSIPPTSSEITLLRKDRSPIRVFCSHAIVQMPDRDPEMFSVGVDLTGLRQTEAALRESEKRFRMVFETAQDCIYIKDRECRYILVNPLCEMMFNRKASEVIGKMDSDIFEGKELEAIRKQDKIVIEGGIVDAETTRTVNGVPTVMHVIKVPMRDADGAIVGVCGFARDITERRRSEDALRESEERYRTLAEASPDIIFLCNPDGSHLYINSLGAAQWGLTSEQFVGRRQEDVFPSDTARKHMGQIREVQRTGLPFFVEPHECLPSGMWISTRLVPVKDSRGETTAIMGIARDVTEDRKMVAALRHSEENFRALAENAIDGIWIADANAHYMYANQSAANLTGYSVDEIMTLRVPQLACDGEAALEGFFALVSGKRDGARVETSLLRRDNTSVPVELSVTRTIWQGQPAVLAITRDIRERKRIEDERRRLAATLLEVQETERKEISSMLHDHLGQLLTLTRLELGSVLTHDPTSRSSMDNALQKLTQALDSVRQLAVSLRPPILDDLGIQTALETLAEEFADSSGIETVFKCLAATLPKLTKNEETCLYRVLQEALTNVARHAEATVINITADCSDNEVRLVVQDNGKGFDLSAPISQRGIGFLGMRERLLRCGGSLEICSTEGRGTTVTARLPAGPAEDRRT